MLGDQSNSYNNEEFFDLIMFFFFLEQNYWGEDKEWGRKIIICF